MRDVVFLLFFFVCLGELREREMGGTLFNGLF